ncbi:MAG: DUF885 family protein, partial [Hyphomonadaceae bacterium]
MHFNRRALLQGSAATLALSALPAAAALSPDAVANTLLERITEQLLRDYPEGATSAGVDRDARAALRSELGDRSPGGQNAIERRTRATLTQLQRINAERLTPEKRLDVDVVRTVYELAAEGFDFPYGDMAILNSNWSYRNTPYVVAQNVGAFVEIPSFLDSSHSITTAADAEAYLARMEEYARQLDGETARLRRDTGRGVVLPDFALARTLNQLRTSRATPYAQWGVVTSLTTRAQRANLDARFGAEAARIAERRIAPALDRQITALEAQQSRTNSNAGAWKLPRGEEYYAWALRAATTTNMTPDEVHEMGLEELRALHAQMDPILRSIGYTEGSVGARMTALGEDPRYQFAEGDAGRAEIMAFIEERIADIRTRLPNAFNTLVRGYLEVVR